MNKMYLQILYSAKKKEGKIVDLSLLTEDEKIALLELYKSAYEKMKLDEAKRTNKDSTIEDSTIEDSDNNESVIEESSNKELVEDEILTDNKESAIAEKKTEDEQSTETEDESSDDIEIVYEDEPTYMDDLMGDASSGVSNYGTDSGDEVVVANGDKSNRTDAFEYTSFTPYKPKYEDIELTNDFFNMNTNMGMQVEVSKPTSSEKYNLKTKNIKSNVKVSKNGAYTIADSYSATKSKMEIPYLKIGTIVFSILCLICFVTQFLHNFEQAKIMNYFCDFCFMLTILFVFISAITNSNVVNSVKGIGLFLSFGMHFICFGIVGYPDGLYRILNQEAQYDLIYGIVSIAYLVALYVFIFVVGIYSMSGKKAITKFIDIVAVVLVIVAIAMIVFSNLAGKITFFYNILPEHLAIVFFAIATALSCDIEHKDR